MWANEKSLTRTGSEVSKRRAFYFSFKLREAGFGLINHPRKQGSSTGKAH
jgi:hypothetical protein